MSGPGAAGPKLIGELINFGTSHDNRNPAVAYSSRTKLKLVVFETHQDSKDIKGRFLNPQTGKKIGSSFYIASTDEDESHPDVVYDPVNNLFLVVWDAYICTPTIPKYCGYIIKGRLVYDEHKEGNQFPGDAFTIASQVTNMTTSYDLVKPSAAFNQDDKQYIVVFQRSTVAGSGTYREIYAQMMDAGAATLTYFGPLSGFEVYNGVPYNVKVTAPDVAGASEYGTFLVTHTVEQVFVDYVMVEHLHDSYQGNGGANQLLGTGFWIAPNNMGDNPLTGDCNNPKVAYDSESDVYNVVFVHTESVGRMASVNRPQLGEVTTIHGQLVRPDFNIEWHKDYGYAYPVETSNDGVHRDPDLVYNGSEKYFDIVYWTHDFSLSEPDFFYVNHRTMKTPEQIGARLTLRTAGADKALGKPAVACGDKRICTAVWEEEYFGDGDADWDVLAQRFGYPDVEGKFKRYVPIIIR
jgi:hypothetical protein